MNMKLMLTSETKDDNSFPDFTKLDTTVKIIIVNTGVFSINI